MAFIDDRGRLFGRVNIIDALVALVVAGLIPVAYGAWLLFRQPQPRITSVEPTTIVPTTTHVRLRGENLRPFLRVSFDQHQGVTFALVSPDVAEVKVPALPAGTYDVILYDVAREVSRLPRAVKVEAAPLPAANAAVLVAGAFVALDPTAMPELRPGAEFTAIGNNQLTLVEIEPARRDTRWVQSGDALMEVPLEEGQQVPALLRATCTIAEVRCQVGGVDLMPGFALSLFTAGGRPLRFVVGEAMSAGSTVDATLQVRLAVPGESIGFARAGDRDRGHPLLAARRATLTSVGSPRKMTADAGWRSNIPWPGAGEWNISVSDTASVVDAMVRVILDRTTDGLRYRGRTVKAGLPFFFETDSYAARGWVLRVDVSKPNATDQ